MRTQAARRRSLARLWAGALGVALLGVAACAQAAPTPLDAYLGNLKTLRADFLQTVADAHGREIDRASGTLIVLRPGKFSWEIHPQNPTGASSGAGQLLVCGRHEPVVLRPRPRAGDGEAGGRRPFRHACDAALRRGGRGQELQDNRGGRARPASAGCWSSRSAPDADFRSALFGFANDELKRMIVDDKLGQTATIIFAPNASRRNARHGRTPAEGGALVTPRR